MKNFIAYNNSFAEGKSSVSDLYDLVTTGLSSLVCNGLYIASKFVSVDSGNKVSTWASCLEDGNYLYTNSLEKPSYIASDSQFNNQSTLNFTSETFKQLTFKFTTNIKTIIICYLQRSYTGYLFYAPRGTNSNNPDDILYYDAFPPGSNSLWQREELNLNVAINSTNRINSRVVNPEDVVGLNLPRILTITNIGGYAGYEPITGISGSLGQVGGTRTAQLANTFNGKIAAIVTFEEQLSEEDINLVELELARLYINYQGASLTEDIYIRQLVNTNLNFDIAPYVIDEWFTITSYEFIARPDLDGYPSLSFTGAVLQGLITEIYNDLIFIRINNSGGYSRELAIPFTSLVRDPIVNSLPSLSTLDLILTTYKDPILNSYSGLQLSGNSVLSWEDARRVKGSIAYNNLVPKLNLTSIGFIRPSLEENSVEFNNKDSVIFPNNSQLLSSSSLSSKTFIWVYEQLEYGFRNMLDTFPDIKGTGELWSVANTSQVHGTTDVTKLITTIQRIPVTTLNYKNKLNYVYIIVAKVPSTTAAISFKGFSQLRGKISFFASWNTILSDLDISNVISLIATRYYSDLSPYIFSNATEFRNISNITIDLKTKVSDLLNKTLTYDLLTPILDSSIDSNGILTVTAVTDDLYSYQVEVTNEDNLLSILEFDLVVTLRFNQLYLGIKQYIYDFNLFLITELDSLVYSGNNVLEWKDYRLNGTTFIGNGTTLTSLQTLENNNTVSFNIDGSSYFNTTTPISGKCFIICYIKKESDLGRFFLLGQSVDSDFYSGINNFLFDSSLTSNSILSGDIIVNNELVDFNYQVQDEVLNVIILNTTAPLTFDQIAKDRVFSDRSVKGYIPCLIVLEDNISLDTAELIHSEIRDYFQPERFVGLFHFDSNILDSSPVTKSVSGTAVIDPTIKKFGSASLRLAQANISYFLTVENDSEFAFLNEDFTISFWIQLNSFPTNEYLSLYTQSDLTIYLYGNKLYVGRFRLFNIYMIETTLSSGFLSASNFNHIQLNRVNKELYLFINGVLISKVPDTFEYRDYNSPILIGQSGTLVNNFIARIDELAIYRRKGFNTSSFSLPTQPYI